MEYGNNMARKQLLELPIKAWDKTKDYSAIIVVPTGRKHDSGFALMTLVGCTKFKSSLNN